MRAIGLRRRVSRGREGGETGAPRDAPATPMAPARTSAAWPRRYARRHRPVRPHSAPAPIGSPSVAGQSMASAVMFALGELLRHAPASPPWADPASARARPRAPGARAASKSTPITVTAVGRPERHTAALGGAAACIARSAAAIGRTAYAAIGDGRSTAWALPCLQAAR